MHSPESDVLLPFVSIIIPMFNSESTIIKCLDSLFNLNYPKDQYEIIIVDNGSTDNCVSKAQQYPIKLLRKPVGNISAVRNYGAKFAKGEIYCFVDSDCIVSENWLMSALEQLRSDHIAATGSGYLSPEQGTWVEKAWLYESTHKPFYTNFITSGNFIIKSSIFNEIGGFNERMVTCEDAEICLRIVNIGYKIINSSDIKMIHLGNSKTIKQFINKELWYGKNMANTFRINWMDKVFIMSNIFLLTQIGIIIGIIQFMISHKYTLFNISLGLILVLVIISSVHRVKRSKKYYYFFNIMMLYYFYFVARSIALMIAFKDHFVIGKK